MAEMGTGQKTCDKKNPEMHIILYLDLRQGITFMASDIPFLQPE